MALPDIVLGPRTFQEDFSIPALPLVATQLINATSQDSTDAEGLARLASSDAGLSADLLRIVNSAQYGLRRPVADLPHAIGLLGFRKIQRLAMATYVMKAVTPEDREERERFWFHSYYSALIARHLGKRHLRSFDAEELYAMALLHDIGKPIYARLFPEHYRAVTRFARTEGVFFIDAERHFGWTSHLTMGALLCDHWNLPDSLKSACEVHELEHLRDHEQLEDVQKVICASNLLANIAEPDCPTAIVQEIEALIQEALGLSDDGRTSLLLDVQGIRISVLTFLRNL